MPGIPTGNTQLAQAGLDNLGSNDRGDKVVLNATGKKLIRIANILIQDYVRRMQRSGNTATGQGADLVSMTDIETKGSVMSLDIMVPEYLMFQNYGVKGLKGGSGKYSFKKGYPSRKMRASILRWVRNRSIRVDKYSAIKRARNKKGMIKDRGVKEMKDKAKDYAALSYAISKSIMNKGIKATGDFDNAIKTVQRIAKKEIAEGLKLDVIGFLKQ